MLGLGSLPNSWHLHQPGPAAFEDALEGVLAWKERKR